MTLKALRAMLGLSACIAVTTVFAAHNKGLGLGGLANNVLEPVGLLQQFVTAACLVIGGSFVFASIIKYKEHRQSPLMIPISTVIFLFIAGLALIGLPFMWMLGKYVNH